MRLRERKLIISPKARWKGEKIQSCPLKLQKILTEEGKGGRGLGLGATCPGGKEVETLALENSSIKGTYQWQADSHMQLLPVIQIAMSPPGKDLPWLPSTKWPPSPSLSHYPILPLYMALISWHFSSLFFSASLDLLSSPSSPPKAPWRAVIWFHVLSASCF